VWKNIVQRGRLQMAIRLMRIACWIPKATKTHTLRLCNTHCFSTATVVTRLYVRLYAQWLSCSAYFFVEPTDDFFKILAWVSEFRFAVTELWYLQSFRTADSKFILKNADRRPPKFCSVRWHVMAQCTFRLSAQRTSTFKSAGGVILVDYWQPRCAHQR